MHSFCKGRQRDSRSGDRINVTSDLEFVGILLAREFVRETFVDYFSKESRSLSLSNDYSADYFGIRIQANGNGYRTCISLSRTYSYEAGLFAFALSLNQACIDIVGI